MDEYSGRRNRLFLKAGFSAALFYSGDACGSASASFRYFSICDIDGSYLVLKKNGGTLFTHRMNAARARKESFYPVKLLGKDAPAALLKAAGRGVVAVCASELSASRFFALKKNARLRLEDASERIEGVRGKKEANELVAISKSASLARRILDGLDPWECRTEADLAARLKIAALEAGAECSFQPIVATGKNTRFPHHIPSAKRLENSVLVDFGVRINGYCSDLTRCYFRGKCERERGAYEKCKGVFWNFLDGLAGCETGNDAFALGNSLVKRAGLPKMAHLIGHGIGLEVHEFPRLGSGSKDPLADAALSIEPAAYFSGFGVRFEDMAARGKLVWKTL